MTRKERTGERSLEFSRWMRSHLKDSSEGLVVQDVDWILMNYQTGNFVLLEEKTFAHRIGSIPPAQSVILQLLKQLLALGSAVNSVLKSSRNPLTGATYSFCGAFLIEFIGGACPDSAAKIFLNGIEISKDKLITFLNLDTADSLAIAKEYENSWIEDAVNKNLPKLKK